MNRISSLSIFRLSIHDLVASGFEQKEKPQVPATTKKVDSSLKR